MMTLRSYPKLICGAPINALKNYVPQTVIEKVKDSAHYKSGSDALVTSSDKTPYSTENRQDCIKRMYEIFQEVAKTVTKELSRKPPKQL